MAEAEPRDEEAMVMVTEEDDIEEDEPPTQPTGGKGAKPVKWPCLICKKNVSSSGVRCGICYLWVHVKCQKMEKELYNILKAPTKFKGFTWRCDSCDASAHVLDAKINTLQQSMKEVEARMVRAEGTVLEVSRKMDSVERRQDKVEEKIEQVSERAKRERIEETRERELRRKNVIIHRMPEAGEDATTVDQRKEWDMASCNNMFKVLKMTWDRKVIRFCRRVGEKGDDPRPLVIGFTREAYKEDLLDAARELRDTTFSEVGIGPDLTQEQRQEESELANEAERRNELRSEDDLAKNLIWKVVGKKGEKRLLKVLAREEDLAGPTRGRGTARGGQRPLPTRGARGGAWGPVGGGRAARGSLTNRGGQASRGGTAERANLLDLVKSTRARVNSKRSREEGEGEEEEEEEERTPRMPPGEMEPMVL